MIEVGAAGERHVHEIYALGPTGPGPGAPGSDDTGLGPEQKERRARVQAFLAELSSPSELVAGEADGERFPIQAIAVRARPAPEGEGDLVLDVVPWPLADVAPGDTAPCTLVTGADAEELLAVLSVSTSRTRYRRDESVYALEVRPLVPPERACADVTVT